MASLTRLSLLVAGAVLLAGALALWLSAAAPSGAASAPQVQGTAVTVAEKTITWGSVASCNQEMGTADFGSALPGEVRASSSFTGCVTSSAPGWVVTASATDLNGDDANAAPIPNANLKIRTTATSGSAPPAIGLPCTSAVVTCTLDSTRTLLSGGSAGTGGFTYDYSLAVPTSATAANYSGTVTFTASN
jgi:hypothetical protein